MKLSEYFGTNFEYSDKEDLVRDIKALLVAQELSGKELDTLDKAWNDGLMESGNTPSKEGRAMLLEKGILCQTCWKGNDYAFSVTYQFGYKVYQALSVKLKT